MGVGELLAILGPNSAGKTTLTRAMSGPLKCSGGCAQIAGVDLRQLSPQELGRTIAYAPQARSAVNLSLTGLDEAETGLDFHNQLAVLKLLPRLVDEERRIVIMNTHYPAHALRADRTILVDSGQAPTAGQVAQVVTEHRLPKLFKVKVRIGGVDHQEQQVPTVTAIELH